MTLDTLHKEFGPIETKLDWHLYKDKPSPTPDEEYHFGPFKARFVHRYKDGERIANFKRRVYSGELLPYTPFKQVELEHNATSFFEAVHSSGQHDYLVTASGVPAGTCNLWDNVNETSLGNIGAGVSGEVIYLVQKAAAKIYGSGWDALTFAGEWKETARMFRNTCRRLRLQLPEIVKRIRRTSVTEYLDPLLEARYGWRPLASDIEDVTRQLLRLDSVKNRYKAVCPAIHGGTDSWYQDTSWEYGTWRATMTRTWTAKTRGTVIADIQPPKFAFNPLTTAWQVTRLSFVVDWVVNVSQYLEAISFLVLASNHTAAGGLLVEEKIQTRTEVLSKNWTSFSIDITATAEGKLTLRTPMSVSTHPLYRLRLDGAKILDLAALTVQALRRL